MTRTVFSLTDTPPPANRQQALRAERRRRTWRIWGILALIWFVGSTAYYGFGASSAHHVSSRPAPLLSGSACHSVLGIDGQQSCQGVANMSRDRRIMLRDRASQRAIEAGSVILGPPIASLLGMMIFMHYTRPRVVIPRRDSAGKTGTQGSPGSARA